MAPESKSKPKTAKPKSNRPRRATYRHGNVAADAVLAAAKLVAEGKMDNLSLRAVAGELGIAHRSLYNHFEDRDALMRAVAAHGFEVLAAAVATSKTPKAFVRAYAQFALDNAALYGVMMAQRNTSMFADPTLGKAVKRMIDLSLAMFGAPDASKPENRRAVMRIWMLLHGGVSLHLNGALEPRSRDAFVAELLKIAGS